MSGQLPSDQLRLPILADAPWRVAVVSPTGRYARNQVAGMIEAGTPLVGGIALGRGGTNMDGLPLYDRIAEFPQRPNIALIYTPAEGVRDAVIECAQARIETIMAVAEYVPVHDALAAANGARAAGSWLIGPNTLGIYVPGRGLLGSIAPSFCKPGRLALIIRSGTLALAMARQLTLAGIGQRIVAHVGGDKEYAFAEAARGFPKPVYAMVVGRHAPAEKQMGHAGALIGSAREGAEAKLKALAAAGCRIVKGPEQAVTMLSELSELR